MELRVDLLGSLTVSSISVSHSVLNSASDAELQVSIDTIMGLSPVKFYSIVAVLSLTSAQFWATFSLLPYAKALFIASVVAYTLSSLALIYSIAQAYFDGSLGYLDAFVGLFSIVWGLVFAGHTISNQSIFGRIFSCLEKYRAPPTDWGYPDVFLLMSRVLILLLGVAVAAGIFFSGISG